MAKGTMSKGKHGIRLLSAALAFTACSGGENVPFPAPGVPTVRSDSAVGVVGDPCDILTDAGSNQGVYNSEALECTSRICLKPVDSVGGVDTGAFCSAWCSQDSDCIGPLRDPSNPSDRRCVTGYTCGIAFVKGKICCSKLCLCKDFYGGSVPTPTACAGDNPQASCQ